MNLADSSTLAATLTTRGFRRVDSEAEADLIILNTCSVREKAEERVFGRLGELSSLKKRKPGVRIAVVGCMAQRLGGALSEKAPHVDYVLGTDRLFELADVLDGVEGSSSVMTAFGHENIDRIEPIKETSYSGFVTISRGCDNFCTYCIVPYVRGKERSHSSGHIIDAVKKMVDEGVIEVCLLGQNVNSYKYEDAAFPDLLLQVARQTDIQRVRFMTSHPKDLSRRLIDVVADEPKLMSHIHLPMQSGNDRILKKMGRVYTSGHYLKIIDYIRERLDAVSITTDIIVGFPTETEQEFEETLAVAERVRFDSAFMFRYSVRPGTAAANYVDDIPEEVKIRRLNRLIDLQRRISLEVNQREVGRTCFCVVEGFSRRSRDFHRARTEGNKTVLFVADNVAPGTILPIRITAADAYTLHGETTELN